MARRAKWSSSGEAFTLPRFMTHQRLNDHAARYTYRPSRRRSGSGGCLRTLGCLSLIAVTGIIILIIAAPLLPGLILQAAGWSPQGQTDQVFQGRAIQSLSLPQNAVAAQTFTLTAPSIGTRSLDTTNAAYRLAVGTDPTGMPSAQAEISESGLYQICRDSTPLCRPGNTPVTVERIDLRPGGAVIYANLTAPQVGGLTGTVGAVVQVDSTGRRLMLTGVDINGQMYGLPDDVFGYRPAELEQIINDGLLGLTVQAGGSTFRLDQISITDAALIVSLR